MRRAVVGRERGRSGRRPGRRGRAFPTGEDAWPRRFQSPRACALELRGRAWRRNAPKRRPRSAMRFATPTREHSFSDRRLRARTSGRPAQRRGTARRRDAPKGDRAMTHAAATHAPEDGMENTMTANGRQGASGLEGTRGLRNAPRAGDSLRCSAETGHRGPEGVRDAGNGPRTGTPPFKHESGHGQSERMWSEASPARSPGRWFGSARAGLGARAGSRTPLGRGTPPETPYVAARLRRGGLLPRFSLLGRAARLLAAVLALAVPLLAVLVLNDAAPAQAQTSQPTPDKLVLEFRRWPHRDHIAELVFIPGPHTAGLTVLAHYQLRWTAAACC